MAVNKEVQPALLKLSDLLSAENATSYRALFEEFMREHEFDLALHVICDYLSSEGLELMDSSNLALIDALHKAMRVDDGCIAEMKAARFQKSGVWFE